MDRKVAIGRRKTSVARVYMQPAAKAGKGTIVVNKRAFDEYFPIDILRLKAFEPFEILEISPSDYDIFINVNGGGITGQAGAIRLGFARNLVEFDPENRPALKAKGMMTRDPRMVERKKYGKPKARKSFQFSKR